MVCFCIGNFLVHAKYFTAEAQIVLNCTKQHTIEQNDMKLHKLKQTKHKTAENYTELYKIIKIISVFGGFALARFKFINYFISLLI